MDDTVFDSDIGKEGSGHFNIYSLSITSTTCTKSYSIAFTVQIYIAGFDTNASPSTGNALIRLVEARRANRLARVNCCSRRLIAAVSGKARHIVNKHAIAKANVITLRRIANLKYAIVLKVNQRLRIANRNPAQCYLATCVQETQVRAVKEGGIEGDVKLLEGDVYRARYYNGWDDADTAIRRTKQSIR